MGSEWMMILGSMLDGEVLVRDGVVAREQQVHVGERVAATHVVDHEGGLVQLASAGLGGVHDVAHLIRGAYGVHIGSIRGALYGVQ